MATYIKEKKLRTMIKGFYHLIALIFITTSTSCSIGLQVNVEANYLNYPISHTSSIYGNDGTLYVGSNLETLENFSFEFKKWGVKSIFEIPSNKDVSDQLNDIISLYGGDAIIDLKISTRKTGVNSLMLFIKSCALISSAITVPILLSEKSSSMAPIAASSVLASLFTPANVEIKIEGTVVRFINH